MTALQIPQAEKETQYPGPVLRYHGGKAKLAPWVIEHFPSHSVYCEPFAGSASVLLQKPRARMEIYNDLDHQVVNVFRVLRDPEQAARLQELLWQTPYSREEFELSWFPCDDPLEQARRTITRGYLGMSTRGTSGSHKTGFRYNDKGGTGSNYLWARYPERLAFFCRRMAAVVIENKPALELIDRIDGSLDGPDALYYCDPPYVYASRQKGAHWRKAYRHEMTDDDHRELAQRLHQVRGMVVISGYPSELYDEIFGDWECVTRKAYADGSKPRIECLWLNGRVSEWKRGRLLL